MEQSNNSEFPKHIYFVRHGEKISRTSGVKIYNNPLSEYGKTQAMVTGDYLSGLIHELFKKYDKKTKVIILCSPYVRCVATCELLVKQLQEHKLEVFEDTIHISSCLKETEKGVWPGLGQKDLANDLEEYEKGVHHAKFKDSEFQLQNNIEESPEYEDMPFRIKRTTNFLNKIKGNHTVDGYEGKIIICVTHQMFPKCLKNMQVAKYGADKFEKPEYKFCCVTCLKYKNEEDWEYVLDGVTKHLDEVDLCRYGKEELGTPDHPMEKFEGKFISSPGRSRKVSDNSDKSLELDKNATPVKE